VNRFAVETEEPTEMLALDTELARRQAAKLERIRAERDNPAVKEALEDVRAAAKGTDNMLVPMKEAFRRMATLGEVCGVLREEWGVYRPESTL
jgi:methylmalonyl-CoA mutase N-terminal domain/subunit